MCLFTVSIFFLFLKNDVTINNLVSQTNGCFCGIELYFFLKPLENTVIQPLLFLPALFFKKTLKNLLGLINFNRYVDFLNLCVGVIGLWIFEKI